MQDNKKSADQIYHMPICMCLGMSIGTAIGVAIDNMSMCMCLGIAFGLCIGSILDARRPAKSRDKTENPHEEND